MKREVTQLHAAALWATGSVVVPAAIIAMLASLLHYLLDLRAVWLGGGGGLKWIGTCFLAAVVLIVRFGRVYGQAHRQTGYIAALGGAMFLGMGSLYKSGGVLPPALATGLAAPTLVLIVGLTWWLAARITRELDLDLRPPEEPVVLYGEILRAHEARLRGEAPPEARAAREAPPEARAASEVPAPPAILRAGRWLLRGLTGTGPQDTSREPSQAVARLALPALLLFALGEPLLLAAPPEVGQRAALAMVVSFLSAGVLLSAGGALGTWRRVRDRGGYGHPAAIPARVGAGALLVGLALIAGLGAPGVRFAGSGERAIPAAAPQGRGGPKLSSEQGDVQGGRAEAAAEPGEGGGEGGEGGEAGEGEGGEGWGGQAAASAAGRVVAGLAALGQVVFKVLAAMALLGAGFVALKTLPRWGAWSKLLGAWLRGLAPARSADAAPKAPPPDPLAGLAALEALPPDQAIAAAYGRLEALAIARGCERPERQTALEFAARLPHPLQPAAAAIRELTTLYVGTQYAGQPAGEAERGRAIEALRRAAQATG